VKILSCSSALTGMVPNRGHPRAVGQFPRVLPPTLRETLKKGASRVGWASEINTPGKVRHPTEQARTKPTKQAQSMNN
jgi:hypothetical protein